MFLSLQAVSEHVITCSTVSLTCPHRLGQFSYCLHPCPLFILPTPQHSLSHLESHFFLDVSAPFTVLLRLFQSIGDSSLALNFFRELIQYCLIASLWINFVKVVFSCDPIFIWVSSLGCCQRIVIASLPIRVVCLNGWFGLRIMKFVHFLLGVCVRVYPSEFPCKCASCASTSYR